jgi:hypothetical protein
MALPTPSNESTDKADSSQVAQPPARGVALALVGVLLVMIALASGAEVYVDTFTVHFVEYRSPLIISSTATAIVASLGAVIIGMWENMRAGRVATPQRLLKGLAVVCIVFGLVMLIATAGLFGAIFYFSQACSAFPGCE